MHVVERDRTRTATESSEGELHREASRSRNHTHPRQPGRRGGRTTVRTRAVPRAVHQRVRRGGHRFHALNKASPGRTLVPRQNELPQGSDEGGGRIWHRKRGAPQSSLGLRLGKPGVLLEHSGYDARNMGRGERGAKNEIVHGVECDLSSLRETGAEEPLSENVGAGGDHVDHTARGNRSGLAAGEKRYVCMGSIDLRDIPEEPGGRWKALT